jgi:hypothetical protein
MNTKPYRFAWFIVLLISASLACQLVSRIGETKSTVEAAATEAKGGLGLLGTAEAAVTEVGGSSLVQTAIAAVTEQAPGLVETAQSFATEQGPELLETAQSSMGTPAADIPVIEGEKSDYVNGEFLVSYAVAMSLQDVKDFYESKMPENGWSKSDQGNVESDNLVVLNYGKDNRNATVTLTLNPVNKKVAVVILIVKK